jgi:hypothetical protein
MDKRVLRDVLPKLKMSKAISIAVMLIDKIID